MNNVASFLPNLPARSSAVSQGPRGDSEALKNSQGDGDGFDAVLSGFSAHLPSGKPTTNAAAPAHSPSTKDGSSRGINALLPMTRSSSADSSTTAPETIVPSGSPAAGQYPMGPASKTAFSNVANVSAPQVQGGQEKDPFAELSATVDESKLPTTPPSTANSTPTEPAARESGIEPIVSAPPAAKPATGTAEPHATGATKLAAPKFNNISGPGTPSANTDATASNGATTAAIAASLQSALPAAPTSGSTAGKGLQSDRSTSGTSKSPDKKSSKSDAPGSVVVDMTTQATMAASIAAVAPPQAVPAGSSGSGGSNESKNRKPAVAPQINVTAQLATDTEVSPAVDQTQTKAISPDSFAASATMTVTTISSATHFAPVARLSPVQQIADAVVGAMPDLSQTSAGLPVSDSTDAVESTSSVSADMLPDPTSVSSSGPVKTLNLELEPPSLGTVTITLNLTPDGLDVQLAASQSSTRNLIEKDKDSLSDQLRQSGYSLSGMAVTLSSHDGSNVANNGSATQNPNGQAASQSGSQPMSYGGSSNGNGTSQNNARNGSGRASTQGPIGAAAGSEAAAPSRRAAAGDLYL